MAKNPKVENDLEAEMVPPLGEPVSTKEFVEMHKTTELVSKHEAHLQNVHPALLPGRVEPINKGLLGEFETELMKATQSGDYMRAAAIENFMAQVGSLVTFVKEIEQKGMTDLKVLCSRIGELFSL